MDDARLSAHDGVVQTNNGVKVLCGQTRYELDPIYNLNLLSEMSGMWPR